jgi:hypothetical protein
MNTIMKKILILCVMYPLVLTSDQAITPFITWRSQGVSMPRQQVGSSRLINCAEHAKFYGVFAMVTEYTRSFNPQELTECLFGCDLQCNNTIAISGSRVANRGAQDWLADYFYLPTDFQSMICFKPIIENFIFDLEFHLGLDDWLAGVYFDVYAPFAHSRWDLGFHEKVINPGINDNDAGYFTGDVDGMSRSHLLNSFSEYAGGSPLQPSSTIDNVIFQPLLNAQMKKTKHVRSRFADLRAWLGWNFICDENKQMSLYFMSAAPTGNRPEGKRVFEAIVGNCHHWEFGGGFQGNITAWSNQDETRSLNFIFNASIAHLFAKREKRTFDIEGKPFSRYMLVEQLDTPVTNLKGGSTAIDAQAPTLQFAQEYAPLANVSTITVDVKVYIQTELLAMFTYIHNHWSFDIGYNFWLRTCEQLEPITPLELLAANNWAFKGDAFTFGFDQTVPIVSIPLSATESKADIHSGTNFVGTRTIAQARQNPAIDGAQPAFASNNDPLNSVPTGAPAQINTSINPVIIDSDSLAIVGNQGMSSTLFAHISYTIDPHKSLIPFIGIGGQVEFGHKKIKNISNRDVSCDQICVTCPVSQWGMWIKGGIGF